MGWFAESVTRVSTDKLLQEYLRKEREDLRCIVRHFVPFLAASSLERMPGLSGSFFTKGWSNIPDSLADELMVSRPLGWWYQTVVLGISSWITVKSKDFSARWGRTAASAWHFTWKSTHHECVYMCFVCVCHCGSARLVSPGEKIQLAKLAFVEQDFT